MIPPPFESPHPAGPGPGHWVPWHLLLGLACWLGTAPAAWTATVTWIGRGASLAWNDAANWSGGAVPGTADEVEIPPRTGPVEIRSGNVTVLRIQAPDGLRVTGGTLTLTEGESRIGGNFTLSQGASLVVRGAKTVLLAGGAAVEWGGDLTVRDGAQARLPNVAQVRSATSRWWAHGMDSWIEAPSLGEVHLTANGYFDVQATGEGRIDLPKLPGLLGPMRVTATEGGRVDLSSLRGRWSSEGFAYRSLLRARNRGSIVVPLLTEFDRGEVDIDADDALPTRQWTALTGGSLTVRGTKGAFASLTRVDDTDLTVAAGATLNLRGVTGVRMTSANWRVQDPGSVLDASALESVAFATASYFDINVSSQGRAILSGLKEVRGPIRITASGGGLVDLQSLEGRWTSEGFAYRQMLKADTGGRILVPGLSEFDRGTIDLDSLEAIPTGKLQALTQGGLVVRGVKTSFEALGNVDGSDLTALAGGLLALPRVTSVRAGGQTWRAQDPGSTIDAGAVRQVSFASATYMDIHATTDGQVNLGAVETLLGPLRVTAGSGGLVDLSGARGRWTSEGFAYQHSLKTSARGRIRIPGITELDRGTLDLDARDGIPTAQLAAVTRSTVHVRGAEPSFEALTVVDDTDLSVWEGGVLRLPKVAELRCSGMTWRARDPGSILDARGLKSVEFSRAGYFDLHAETAGRIDLSGLTRMVGPFRVSASGGGVVDFSGATGLWRGPDVAYTPWLRATAEGRILMPNAREFEGGQLLIALNAFLSTEQFVRIADATVVLDGGTVAFPNLRDRLGTTFELRAGAQAIFTPLPLLVTGPLSQRVATGATVEFSVVAEGDGPLVYQWRKNGQNIRDARGPILRLEGVTVEDAGAYSVVVANRAGLVESQPAILSLALPTLPFADAFVNRGRLSGAQGAGTTTTIDASRETGEPAHAGKRGGRSVWLTWRAPDNGRMIFSTAGSSFDTMLAVYTGSSLGTLVEVASDDDGAGFLASRVEFDAVRDVDYHFVVDGYAGAAGTVVFNWVWTMGLAPLPRLVAALEGGTVLAGADWTLAAPVEGENLRYQWYFDGNPVPGGTLPALVLPAVTRAQAGLYAVQVTTAQGQSLRTRDVLLEVVARPDEAPARDKREDLFPEPANAQRALFGAGGAPFTSVAPGIPGSRETSNGGAHRAPDDPMVLGELGGATLWFRFRASTSGWMAISTEGSEIPTVLGVYTNRTTLQEVALAVPIAPATHSEVMFGAHAGEDYLVMVDGVEGAQGRIQLSYSLALAPVNGAVLSLVDGGLLIQQTVGPGNYEVAVGDDLNAWTPMFTTNVFGGMLEFLETQPHTHSRRFYRVNGVP